MTNKLLLLDLRETYLQLQPSSIHGIGVFAIRHIPKGCRAMFTKDRGEWIRISFKEVDALPAYSKKLISAYCTYDQEGYYIERYGFKKMDLANFINHSSKPNIASINNGKYFEAIKDIKTGDELFIDYSML